MIELKELSDIVRSYYKGDIDLETVKEKIIAKDSYSGKEVAEMLGVILEKQDSMQEIIKMLLSEHIPAEEIVTSFQFWLGKAYKNYNMKNLARSIDSYYKDTVSSMSLEKQQKALADHIYSTDFEKKDEEAAHHVAQSIAKEYLSQKRIKGMFELNYGAGKDFLEQEKTDEELIKKIRKMNISVPENHAQGTILKEKAAYLEKQGKLDEAADIYYTCEQWFAKESIRAINRGPYASTPFYSTPFYSFCKRTNRKDPRILDIHQLALENIASIKDPTEITRAMIALYEKRSDAYKFLGMKKEAEADRKKREELLKKI